MRVRLLTLLLLVALALGIPALAADNPYQIEPPVPKGYDMPYTITVYLANQLVVVYDAKTLEPARQMICSSGAAATPTKRGTFTLPGVPKSTDFYWFGTCYVRYPTRIDGGYYFHSVLYETRSASSLTSSSWSALGRRASHGCIRLTPIDAQWISYNCKKGTRVRIVGGASDHDLKLIHDEILREVKRRGDGAYQPTLKPTPTPPPPTLQLGSTGTHVRSLQTRLIKHGFYPGAINGSFDAATELAWNEFQTAKGWQADGIATTDEQRELLVDKTTVAYRCTLKRGSTGCIVTAVEARLRALGFFSATPNELYNDVTIAAVKAYQQAAGLPATGILTPAMQETLFSPVAPTPTPAPKLQLGSRGALVTSLQRRLLSLGFYSGAANGIYNAATETAVSLYQRAIGVPETGEADSALQRRIRTDDTVLGSERKLVLRTTGVIVKAVEERLLEMGYFKHVPDEIYDKKTIAAMKPFQTANGMAATGLCAKAEIQAILGID